jgi:hypothetical protein
MPYKHTVFCEAGVQFFVLRMRFKGRPLERRELVNREPATGDLRVEDCFDESLNRHVRTARLWTGRRVPDELPALCDVTLLAMSPQAFTLTGFERLDGIDFAQSWLVMQRDPRR